MKRIIVAMAFAFLVAWAGVAAAPETPFGDVPVPDQRTVPPKLAAAIKALVKGDVGAALKGAREFTREQPGSALGQEVLGAAALASRQWNEAEQAPGRALRRFAHGGWPRGA